MAANALLVLRAGVQSGARAMLISGVALGIVAIALVVVGVVRRRPLTMPAPIAPAAKLIGLTSISVALAAACGFWSIAQ